MSTRVSVWLPRRALSLFLAGLLIPFFLARPTLANEPNNQQNPDHKSDHTSKVVGGYFEEWSIYGAGYNVANLQANGVADKLTHLTYAFGDATPTGCAIADSWPIIKIRLFQASAASPTPGRCTAISPPCSSLSNCIPI